MLGLACGFLLFGIYLLYVLYLKIEIDRQGIVIKSLFSRVTIPRSHIESLFLERDYGSEDDPTFNIHIDYLDMPVDDAPDEAEVYTSVISGALIEVSIEALFDLIIREYGFEEDVGKKD